jgi:heterodisulfide reductase subunit B
VPILFFTQLMGLAFGAEASDLGIGSEVVSARHALERIGIEVPVVEPPPDTAAGPPPRTKREKRPQGLPMPTMPDEAEVVR